MGHKASGPHFLALDFGTSHLRAAVGKATGAAVAVANRPVAYYKPDGAPDTALEFDPVRVWNLAVEAVKEAIHASEVPAASIKGVGVASQRHGLVMLDETGSEVYAGPNKDMRAVFQGGEVDAVAGDDLWNLTGHGPGFLTWWARLMWMKEEAPRLSERARSAFGIADWLAYRLTGALTIDTGLAIDSGVGELTTGQPAGVIAGKLGIDASIFPPVSTPGSVIGGMSKVAANQLGLHEAIPVIKAGPDTQAALVGMGVSEPNHAGIATGWSTPVQCVTNQLTLDSTRTLWTGRHTVSNRWVVEGNSGVMGGAYDWLISMLGGSEDPTEAMARFDAEASRVERGARGVAAYLGPSLVQYENIGLRSGGLLFPVPLAFEPPDGATIVRAALESFAFAIRLILDRIRELTGPVATVSVGGGMTRSATFLDVLANVIESPLYVSEGPEATLLGTITLAAAAVEEGPGLESGLIARRSELRQLHPSPSSTGEYRDLFDEWVSREQKLLELEH